jgi:Kef-type K+ transport system membrane component KefB
MIETILNIYKTFNAIILSNPLSTIGLLLVVSFLGSKIFQRFGIPQVVGFIVLGVLHGPSFLNVVPLEVSQELLLISEIALGLIGFDMGSHLHLNEIRKLGKLIINVITATTFVVQIIGPIAVKFAITRAGEVGKAIEGGDVWASGGAQE